MLIDNDISQIATPQADHGKRNFSNEVPLFCYIKTRFDSVVNEIEKGHDDP